MNDVCVSPPSELKETARRWSQGPGSALSSFAEDGFVSPELLEEVLASLTDAEAAVEEQCATAQGCEGSPDFAEMVALDDLRVWVNEVLFTWREDCA